MVDLTLPLPGLSPVSGKSIVTRFDGGRLSSDGGLLMLRAVEKRLGIADRLANCIKDPRDPDLITHSMAEFHKTRSARRFPRKTFGRGPIFGILYEFSATSLNGVSSEM